VKETIAKILEGGEDVIAVCHFYGGILLSEAVCRLLIDHEYIPRSGAGKILWLVYLSASVPLESQSKFLHVLEIYKVFGQDIPHTVLFWDAISRVITSKTWWSLMEQYFERWQQDGFAVLNSEGGNYFLIDVPESDRKMSTQRLGKQSFPPFQTKLPALTIRWRLVLSSCVLLCQDRAIAPQIQETLLDQAAQDARGKTADLILFSNPVIGRLRVNSGHNVMLSHPAVTKDYLLKIANRALNL
jgi:hypothetical protein